MKGFTLLEMIVSVGIFSVVAVASTNILILSKNAQLKAATIQNVLDNVRFGLEAVTKDLRTGFDFFLASCNGRPQSQINFTDQTGNLVGYAFYQNSIYKVTGGGDCADPAISAPLTSSDVIIELMAVRLTGTGGGGNDGQPRIVFSIQALSRESKILVETRMNLQTTVTQRIRDPKR